MSHPVTGDSRTGNTAFIIDLMARCLRCDRDLMTTLAEDISDDNPERLLDRFIQFRILDRVAARAVLMIASGELQERDLKQLVCVSNSRTRLGCVVADRKASVRAASPRVLEPGSILGRYTIQSLLGIGGVGVVYRAAHPLLGTPVALKVGAAERIRPEAKVLARITHPNVIRFLDVDGSDSGTVLVLEYAGRHSLKDRLLRSRRLRPAVAFRVGRDVARGLRATYRAGFLHGDVKPGNILLGDNRAFKLADFHLARPVSGRDAGPLQLVEGSWAYAAPERFNESGDHRSDVYSLALTLYHLITGVAPVGGKGHAECLRLHRGLKLEPLHWTEPDVPRSLSTLLLRMASSDPDSRPATYDEVITELSRACARTCHRV